MRIVQKYKVEDFYNTCKFKISHIKVYSEYRRGIYHIVCCFNKVLMIMNCMVAKYRAIRTVAPAAANTKLHRAESATAQE